MASNSFSSWPILLNSRPPKERKQRKDKSCLNMSFERSSPNLFSSSFPSEFSNQKGKSIGASLEASPSAKPMIAVDIDEVLGNFVSAINQFIADRYSLDLSVSDYHVYDFFKIWNCSRDEASRRVHEFFTTHYFKDEIYPIPGAREMLQKLSKFYKFSIVTSRQNIIKEHTIEWVERHYPGIFEEFHFGNHFALDGKSRTKSDICKSIGAEMLIDDQPRYALDCAAVGINVLLFDYENSYPWSKAEYVQQNPFVTKVQSWEEVERVLMPSKL